MNDPAINPYAPPQTVDPPPQPRRTALPGEVTLGARIAGGLLIANGVLTLIEKAMTSSSGPSGGISSGFVGILFDFIIGFTLFTRNPKYLGWAIIRAALGALIYGGIHIAQGDVLLAVFQLVVSGSFLLLLIGDAGKARIAAACSLFGIYTVLEVIGLATLP